MPFQRHPGIPNKDRVLEPKADEQRLKDIQENGSLEDLQHLYERRGDGRCLWKRT